MILFKMKNRDENNVFTGYWTLRVKDPVGRLLYEDIHVKDCEVKGICAKFSTLCAQCIEEGL